MVAIASGRGNAESERQKERSYETSRQGETERDRKRHKTVGRQSETRVVVASRLWRLFCSQFFISFSAGKCLFYVVVVVVVGVVIYRRCHLSWLSFVVVVIRRGDAETHNPVFPPSRVALSTVVSVVLFFFSTFAWFLFR